MTNRHLSIILALLLLSLAGVAVYTHTCIPGLPTVLGLITLAMVTMAVLAVFLPKIYKQRRYDNETAN